MNWAGRRAEQRGELLRDGSEYGGLVCTYEMLGRVGCGFPGNAKGTSAAGWAPLIASLSRCNAPPRLLFFRLAAGRTSQQHPITD